MKKLEPTLVRRRPDPTVLDAARAHGLHPVVARVLAQRIGAETDPLSVLNPPLSKLDSPSTLPDIEKAARRVGIAVMTGEVIGCSTDFDVDGSASAHVLLTALTKFFGHPVDRTCFFVGHRLKDGHGLTDTVAERILSSDVRPTLLITADHGSSDELRIALLKRHGIDTIVSDHHGIPAEGIPQSAYAVVSPARADSNYPDRTICGCLVAFLMMHLTRQFLIQSGHLDGEIASLNSLLGSVAAATVADCVDLRSINNRAVIKAGLSLINQGFNPAWKAFRTIACKPEDPVTAETLAFVLGPHINARSRVADATASVRFLMAESDQEGAYWWRQLVASNDLRKEIQREMTNQALEACWPQVEAGRFSIVYYGGPTFTAGVHGIVASKLVEAYGRVTVLLSPMEDRDDLITGSCRTIEGCDVKLALDWVAENHPGLIKGYGGHKGAGGLKLAPADLDAFSAAFENAVRSQIRADQVGPKLYTDGTLPPEQITLSTLEALDLLEPYGRHFDAPTFDGTFTIKDTKVIGDGTHLSMVLSAGKQLLKAVWFRAMEEGDELPVRIGQQALFFYQIKANRYQGRVSPQVVIRYCRPKPEENHSESTSA